MAANEITQEQFDRVTGLWNRAADLQNMLLCDNLTLAQKLILKRERAQLLADRRAILGMAA